MPAFCGASPTLLPTPDVQHQAIEPWTPGVTKEGLGRGVRDRLKSGGSE
jgi:hypothetical protein